MRVRRSRGGDGRRRKRKKRRAVVKGVWEEGNY